MCMNEQFFFCTFLDDFLQQNTKGKMHEFKHQFKV